MDPEALAAFESGKALLDAGNASEAVSALAKATRLAPNVAEYHAWYAQALNNDDKREAALREAELAIQLDPQSGKGYRQAGHAARVLKQYPRAIQAYSQAIQIDPRDDVAYRYRGRSFMAHKDYPKAIADFTQAISLTEGDPRTAASNLASRGDAYRFSENYASAIADYSQAIALVPVENAGTYYWGRGVAYHGLKDYTKALGDFGQAIAIDPKDPRNYDWRQDSLYQLQDWPNYVLDGARFYEVGGKPKLVEGDGIESPALKLNINTGNKHFSESLLPTLTGRGEKLVGQFPLSMILWDRRSGHVMVNGASFPRESGMRGMGYVCLSNQNVYLVSLGQPTVAREREVKRPLSFLASFLPGGDEIETCKTDQFWTVPNHSIKGAQIITDSLVKAPSVRLVTPSQTWDLYTYFDDSLPILCAALTLASTGKLTDWWPKAPSKEEPGQASTIDLLKQLGELVKIGVITAEEFEAKKRELLARL